MQLHPAQIVAAMDSINEDRELAESLALALLLTAVPQEICDAYKRVLDRNRSWNPDGADDDDDYYPESSNEDGQA